MAPYLHAFLSCDPLDFAGRDLTLPKPERGGTWTLQWHRADGEIVASATALYTAHSDSLPRKEITEVSPLPARLQIFRSSGRYVPHGMIGRLEYGHPVEAAIARLTKEPRQLQQAITRLEDEADKLKRQLKQPALPLAELTRALSARLSALPKGSELPPLGILRLAELARVLQSRFPAAFPPAPALPPVLRDDLLLNAIEHWCDWQSARARSNGAQLPPDIAQHAVILWKAVQNALSKWLLPRSVGPGEG